MTLRDRIVKRASWLEGLAIVLALLGHDVLVASRSPGSATAAGTNHQHNLADRQVAVGGDHADLGQAPLSTVAETGGA